MYTYGIWIYSAIIYTYNIHIHDIWRYLLRDEAPFLGHAGFDLKLNWIAAKEGSIARGFLLYPLVNVYITIEHHHFNR